MSSEWQPSVFGDLVVFISAKARVEDADLATYISTENMEQNFGGVKTATALPSSGSVTKFKVGDTLFSNIRTYFKKVWQAEFEGFCSNDVLVFRTNDKRVLHPSYLHSLCRWDRFTEFSVRTSKGAKMPRGDRDALVLFQFELPPIKEQRAIAEILSALDDRITLLRETNTLLEQIAQTIFKSWFVDFDPVRAKQEGRMPEGMDEETAALFPDSFEESAQGLIPMGWELCRLGDVTSRITKGTTPTTLKKQFVASGINFIKAESMTSEGGFIPEKFSFIDDETHRLLARSQLQVGDVLISIAGTIGRIAVVTDDYVPANTNQAVALVRPIQDRLPSGLVSRFLQSGQLQKLMGERVVQAVQANLSLGTLADLQLLLPPSGTTSKLYESGMAQVDSCKVGNDQKIRILSALRDTLLPRLISGKLRLPEANLENVLS